MHPSQVRKNKVTLSDYDYKNDVRDRILLSKLSLLESQILLEIVENSLKFNIEEISDFLDIPLKNTLPAVEKLSETKLFKIQDSTIIVDKEKRKYFETHSRKFSEGFTPNVTFILSLLTHVPIHLLPNWYNLPKNSDDILESIVEKYFLTPKVYQRHLEDLNFDDDILNKIKAELFANTDMRLSADYIMQNYNLSREQFEEYVIQLEFNFVCCRIYTPSNDRWEEWLTPLEEWKSYLEFLQSSQCQSIVEHSEIIRVHPHDFGFVEEMNELLTKATATPSSVNDIQPISPIQSNRLIQRIIDLELAHITNDIITPTPAAALWLKKNKQDQCIDLYINFINQYRYHLNEKSNFSDRDLREIEKQLKKILNQGWILFDDFLKSMHGPIGSAQEVTLERKGKKSSYNFPQYNSEEILFIRKAITQHLFEAGMVALGNFKKQLCFTITPFGRMSLAE